MLGEVLAIATALMGAASTILSAETLRKMDPIRSNAIKTLFSTVLMLPIAFVSGEMNDLTAIKAQGLLLVILAAIIGFGIGDTLLYKSITLIGVSRAYTIAYTQPLFTLVIAVLFLGESFFLMHLIGTILIVISVVMVLGDADKKCGKVNMEGVSMAVATALTWAIGTIVVALGLREISVILANALRYPVLSLFLFLLSRPRKKWSLDKRNLMLLSASGILGMVLGGITFLFSVQLIGAARSTPLSASSPVWASIMSSLILKEKVTPRLLLSSLIVVIGIYFLTLQNL